MKNSILAIVMFCVLNLTFFEKSNAQSAELIGGNLLNGALTGSALSLAVMGLNNEGSFRTLQIGLGAGLLAGTGMAIYDVASLPPGQQFFISGIFNDGKNSSIIVLLDTAYGAALGMAVGTAVILIANKSLVKGVQYGASTGAWIGFGVGLVDSFVIAERNRDFISSGIFDKNSILSFDVGTRSEINLLAPGIAITKHFKVNSLTTNLHPVLNVISVNKTF